MNDFTLYIIKATGLIALFYAAYHLLLKKETFFTPNRWFLLAGLVTSALLPLAVYTRVISAEAAKATPLPVRFVTANPIADTPAAPAMEAPLQIAQAINWYDVALGFYAVGVLFFAVRFVFDILKLRKVIKGMPCTREGRFKMVDSPAVELPFSFFNYIVYNSAKLSPGELESIICHEKVHSSQKHSADMLISQLFCIVFWFNPVAWLYKKSISQNLEFIADAEAARQIPDLKAYQKTLLKITVQHDCIAITNHFYQSLIKKRIVMLNTPQSKRRNSLKFALMVPVLTAFILLFQVDTVAQVKEQEEKADIIAVEIKSDMTDKELSESLAVLNKEFGCNVAFSNIKRNKDKQITGIEFTANGNEYSAWGDGPQPRFYIIAERMKHGIDISVTAGAPKKFNIVSAKAIVFEDISTNPAKKNTIIKGYGPVSWNEEGTVPADRITFLAAGTPTPEDLLGGIKEKGVDYEKAFIMIDGKEADVDELRLLSLQPQMVGTSIIGKGNAKTVKKYGKKAENGVVILTTLSEEPEVRTYERNALPEPSFRIAPEQQHSAVMVINKTSNEDDLKMYSEVLEDMGIHINYSNIVRDEKGIIKNISIAVEDKDGSKSSATWRTPEGETGIPSIKVGRLEGSLVATSNDVTN